MELNYNYATCVANSERVAWRVDDVLPPTAKFDFAKRFLPTRLCPNESLEFLSDAQRLLLNQLSGKAYMNLFGFVEVYIEAMVLDHAHAVIFGDRDQMRALARFADEEVKHQQLFARFSAMFDAQLGARCEVLDSAQSVAQTILSTSPLCVLLTTLHIEQMTQQHYVEAIRDDAALDPTCAEILRCHWLEESQHAKIDLLLLHSTFNESTAAARGQTVDEYLAVLDAFDGLLAQQAQLDARSLATLSGTTFSDEQRRRIEEQQHSGYRHTFLLCGLTNPAVRTAIAALWPEHVDKVVARSERLDTAAPSAL